MTRFTGSTKTKFSSILKLKYLFLLTTILIGGSFLFTAKNDFRLVSMSEEAQRTDVGSSSSSTIISNYEERYSINTTGCTIPSLNPFDKSIKKLVYYPSKLRSCPDENNPLLGSNSKKIWIRYIAFQYYKIKKNDNLSCCYRSFFRPAAVEDVESPRIDDRVKYSPCTYFDDLIDVRDEFVRVSCSIGGKVIYEQFFLFALKKQFKKHGKVKEIRADQNKSTYNILIMGIDAVSRLNFHRTMPNTANFLHKNDAVEFMGYNKVGDNTFPNLIPMLMGIKVTELKKTCYPYETATFDHCPFIWEWFKQAGYYTALGEDASNLGTFNYVKSGFSVTPTDYYLHTFMTEAIKHAGAIKDINSFLCMRDIYFYKVLLKYVEDLTGQLTNRRLFGFFWEVSMSHDFLNYPMKMDDDYFELLNNWESSGYLNDSIIIFVSDHGIRWGDIRLTKQGRLEERLPLLYVLLPKSFRDNYKEAYNNFKLNRKRLTTPFDVHATLSDLIDLKNVENDMIIQRSRKHYAQERSISLFLPMPINRTCRTADIDDHWCTCHKEIVLTKINPRATKAAKALVGLINDLLKDYTQCATLVLTEVVGVTEVQVGQVEPDESTWEEYRVVAKTVPGGGVFEGTLRQDGNNLTWRLLGTPSRLNLYGNQSRCIDNYLLKLYCYCN